LYVLSAVIALHRRAQLAHMAKETKATLAATNLDVIAAAVLDAQLSDRDVTPVAEALVARGVPLRACRQTCSCDAPTRSFLKSRSPQKL
jgi:hypothetical protein